MTVHEREEARGDNGTSVLRSGSERARERAGGGENGWVRSGRQQGNSSRRSVAGQGARSRAVHGGHAAAMAYDCWTLGALNV
jgi:hypothetical protein